jgi:hypothetical protein
VFIYKTINGLKKGYRHIRAWRLAVFFRTGNRCYLDWQLANKGTDSLTSHFVLAYQGRVWYMREKQVIGMRHFVVQNFAILVNYNI